ncbi:MAG: FAD-binding oxidoreductase [Candidatus Woesearchaeota archaeon]|nr:FAD-binding oxidoreductase [Candidatus Woesearchaeota archaeon]
MKAILKKIRVETDSVKTFCFETQPFTFISGQFVTLKAKIGAEEVKRHYSIASSPKDDLLELTIAHSKDGKMSTYMHHIAKTGDIFEIEGPLGKFTHVGFDKIVMIAGGSGVVPFRSMINSAGDEEMVLFYSTKRFEDIIYEKEFFGLKKKNIRIIYTLTGQPPTSWKGYTGRLNMQMMLENLRDPKEYSYFICGPLEMVRFFASELKNLGIEHIKREVW